MPKDYLFVYGTLRRGCDHPMHQVLARYGCFVAEGSIQGKLYEIKGYPGAVESSLPDDRVYGELYEISDQEKAFPPLDDYEECSDAFPLPHEYIRKQVSVLLPDGTCVLAWGYIFNYDVSQRVYIEHGDYLRFMRKNKF